MNKRTIVLFFILAGVGAAYLYRCTELFHPPTIQVVAQVRPLRSITPGGLGEIKTYPVTFAFDRDLRLTEVKVVSVEDAATNKFPHALWHLITDSNSLPVKAVFYGQSIRGMKPKTPQARPEPLLPAVKYRFYVYSGKFRGQVEFKTQEVPGSVAPEH